MSDIAWNLLAVVVILAVIGGIGAFLYYNLDKPPIGTCIHQRDRYWCKICNPMENRKGDRRR